MPGWARGRRAFLGAVATLILAASSGASDEAEEQPLMLRGMTFVSSRDGANEVVLRAAQGRLYIARRMAELSGGVEMSFIGEAPLGRLDLRCDGGEYNLETGDFLAKGRVRGQLADGRIFSSPWLSYDAAAELVYTRAEIVLKDGEQTLRGGGLRYFVSDGRLHLRGGAAMEDLQ